MPNFLELKTKIKKYLNEIRADENVFNNEKLREYKKFITEEILKNDELINLICNINYAPTVYNIKLLDNHSFNFCKKIIKQENGEEIVKIKDIDLVFTFKYDQNPIGKGMFYVGLSFIQSVIDKNGVFNIDKFHERILKSMVKDYRVV